MDIWVVYSNKGILESCGWFESKKDCEVKCAKLRESMRLFRNAYFIPLKLEKGDA